MMNANQEHPARPRILFVAEAVTLAHVMRPIQLARSLDAARFDIRLACHPRYLKLFPDLAFEHIGIDSIASEMFMRALAKGQRVYSAQQLERYVEEDLSVIEAFKPDLVIGDFRLSLAVSAPLAGVPYCTVTNAYWSPYASGCTPIPEHPLAGLLGAGAAQHLFDWVRPLIFAWHARPLNQIRRRHGLPSLGHNLRRSYTWADHVLYADIPELTELHNPPANHHFLGPVLWSPSIPLPPWWEELPGERPIVYLNLGSSGRHDLLPLALEALSDQDVTVIAATLGRPLDTPVPDNAFLVDYLPGDAAAARASLVICNGGSPATQQALAMGVPVMGIASNMDQHMNMASIERFGAGRLLRSEQVTRQSVKDAVSATLEQAGYKAQAVQVKALYQRYPVSELFPALIEDLLA
ncbi:glycosyl transferase family 1 [Candidatus Tenderia electrophaga]|jgi:UDP:flavonoid glycosyltransferase YjiC (YdhE family)|uniref:Glycosyl transferase family 1 n=1 Tax=Candidatus Tenderia electrophaga TaxID=1748243 RepID=A0A0S2TG34_9GAMM|nr:glycosyl transferase family 1 [Candidatus Tenderia electrophaga]